MIHVTIISKAKKDKVDDIKDLYSKYFAKLRTENVRIDTYQVLQDKKDPTVFVTVKRFKSREDERRHHTEKGLREFVTSFNQLCEEGQSVYHEMELFASLT